MAEKKSHRIGIPSFFIAAFVVVMTGWTTGWLGSQQPPSGSQVFQQPWVLKNISADQARRSLLQTLPQNVVESVLIQVNPASNEINLVGNAQMVQFVGQKLQEIDKPGAPLPYMNTVTPPPLSLNAPSQSQPPLSMNQSNGITPSATNITLRDSMQNSNYAVREGYEPGTYFCKPSHLAMMYRELQSRYGHDSNIGIGAIQDSGKIFVWAPQSVQREITTLMTQKEAWAEVPAGRDLREFDGSLIRVTPQARPAEITPQPVIERTHTPKYATLDQIEAKLQGLFGKRLTGFSQPDEKQKKYRVAIPRANGMLACDLILDYPNYQLNIRAPQTIAEEMLRLLQSIDQQAPDEGYDRQYIAIPNSDPEQIRKLLEICRSKVIHDSSRRSRPKPDNNPNMLAYQRNGDPNHQAMRQVNYTTQDDGGFSGLGPAFGQGGGLDGMGTLGNIPIVEWKFQVLPELDVVIIDAPPEEVKRVMDLIAELERLSEYAKSEIEIMPLKHVQCEALDSLLRTQLRIAPATQYSQARPVYLYEEMFNTKQGRAWVLPLRNPNAMLIVGWGQTRDAMKLLIEQLDQPVKEETSLLRVIKLEYAPVVEVVTALTQFFAPPTGMAPAGFYPQIRWLSDPRTNTLIVQAGMNDYQDIQRIIAEVDVPTGGPKLQVQTFKMKNLLATAMVTALQNALDFALNGTQDNRMPAVEIIMESDLGKQIIESGFLDEVKFSAVPENNTLIVTARSNSMPLIEELINMLDLSPGTAMVKVIAIKYSDAATIRSAIETIFPAQIAGATTSVALPGAEGGETFIPMRFATDTRSNSIVVSGAENDIAFIETLIMRLDQKDALQQEMTTYQLRNSSAVDVAGALDQYIRAREQLQVAGNVSAYQRLQDAIIVIPESITNSLILSARRENMEELMEMVKKLDTEPPQVMIQVLIAEVTLSNNREFGIELGLQDPILFGRSTATTGGYYNFNDPSAGLGNSTSADSLATSGTVATQMLSNFATGRINSDSGFGGLTFAASSDAVSVLIRAMQECNRVEILSRPMIQAQDNQLAVIFVGQDVTLPSGISQNQTGYLVNTTPKSVGLFVGVVPRISKGATPEEPDKIDMMISASNSSISADGISLPSGSGSVRVPNVITARVETIVSALDGETVILGGLLKTEKQELTRRVPFLSNIPIAGNLFKYEYEKNKRTELIIIMRPTIVRRGEGAEALKRVEFNRMSWTLRDVTKLHGDIGYYNSMSRQPVTGGAPTFAPDPVDMSQLRDLPMPSNIPPTNTTPSYMSPSSMAPSSSAPAPGFPTSSFAPTPGYMTATPTPAPQLR